MNDPFYTSVYSLHPKTIAYGGRTQWQRYRQNFGETGADCEKDRKVIPNGVNVAYRVQGSFEKASVRTTAASGIYLVQIQNFPITRHFLRSQGAEK